MGLSIGRNYPLMSKKQIYVFSFSKADNFNEKRKNYIYVLEIITLLADQYWIFGQKISSNEQQNI